MKRFPLHLLLAFFLILPLAGSFAGNAFFAVVEDPDIPGNSGFGLLLTDADLTSD